MPPFALPLFTTAAYCPWKSLMQLLSRFTASLASTPSSFASWRTTVVLPAQDGPISITHVGRSEALPSTRVAASMAVISSLVRGRNFSTLKSMGSPVADPSFRASTNSGSSAGGKFSEWPSIRRSHIHVWLPQGAASFQSIWRLISWKRPTGEQAFTRSAFLARTRLVAGVTPPTSWPVATSRKQRQPSGAGLGHAESGTTSASTSL
mmetsp:Transcript_90431/g.233399  ORF Transcript_90431/g.233399 Transcript_90431/m.233399 type:complete len:207 (+) Transcript_90431:934-1554(+)